MVKWRAVVASATVLLSTVAAGCASTPQRSTSAKSPAGSSSSTASHRSTISNAELKAILQRTYPSADEWRVVEGGNRAMQWQGLIGSTQRVVVAIDMYTGTVLSHEGPEGVEGAAATVKGFYAALADGNPEAAWLLLNPVSYNPNPSFRYPNTYQRFMAQHQKPGSPVSDITSATWMLPGPGFKYEICECYVFGGGTHTPGGFVNIKGSLANGQSINTVVVRGSNGTWSLLWDPGPGDSLISMG